MEATTPVFMRTREQLERCFRVMKELRPQLELDTYFKIYEEAHKADGYEIVAIQSGEEVLAVMGYRFLWDYVRGKHLYVDDLVTTKAARSHGLGAQLLQFAENIAVQSECKSLRLCTGVENTLGIKFYERSGWTNRSLVFVKKL